MFMGLWNKLFLTKPSEAQICLGSLEVEMPTELVKSVFRFLLAEVVLFCPGAFPMGAGPHGIVFFFRQYSCKGNERPVFPFCFQQFVLK